ncbi:MAG TPA: ABC-F family ATP-binding cassette domain-containing protein [Cyclobacteriaceae bacterium]
MNYLSVESISKSFGENILFDDISFGLNKGEKATLVGVNGSGKSTLLKIISGDESPDYGNISFRKGIRVAYLPQQPILTGTQSIMDFIFDSEDEKVKSIKAYEQFITSGINDHEALQVLIDKLDATNAWDYERLIKEILGKLQIYDLSKRINELSGGQQKRVALGKALVSEPDLIILDEPTNHIDQDTIEWLEDYLQTSTISILMVTHDRYFLDRISNQILELDNHRIYQYKGDYSYFLEKKSDRESMLAQEVSKAKNLYKKEIEWLRRQPKARGTKAKYRVENVGKIKDKATQQPGKAQVELKVEASRQGKKILELKNISKSFEEGNLFSGFSYTFKKQDKIGIVGKNGSGKTTFLKVLTGLIKPDNGEIIAGQNTKFGYYTQSEIAFQSGQKVIEAVQEVTEVVKIDKNNEISVSQFLNHFLFSPKRQYDYIEKLSGGEKRRLQLLLVLIKQPNFLILDEPTNDLDIMTLNILEEYLEHFQGSLLIVSHDRYFLDRLVDHLFVFEGNGLIRDFNGNYSDYREIIKSNREADIDIVKKENFVKKVKTKKTGLSFSEQREMKNLESDISKLELRKKELEEKLNSGEQNHVKLFDWSEALEKVNEALDEKELRWLVLEEKGNE